MTSDLNQNDLELEPDDAENVVGGHMTRHKKVGGTSPAVAPAAPAASVGTVPQVASSSVPIDPSQVQNEDIEC